MEFRKWFTTQDPGLKALYVSENPEPGRDLRYLAATDGAATVEFTSLMPIQQMKNCVAKALPQVSIEPASQH